MPCVDGYAGGWNYGPGETNRADGYDGFVSDGNPFSNKIVLMDEIQNLLQPSAEIQKSKQRVLMLDRLKSMLATATNSVLVGFCATPLTGEHEQAKPLLDVIKGRGNETLTDEGFISYFMSTPSAVFPLVRPKGVPKTLPVDAVIEFPLMNLTKAASDDGESPTKKPKTTKSKKQCGNLAAYVTKMKKGGEDSSKLSTLCSLGQHYSMAGSFNGPVKTIRGAAGKLLKMPFEGEEPDGNMGYHQ